MFLFFPLDVFVWCQGNVINVYSCDGDQRMDLLAFEGSISCDNLTPATKTSWKLMVQNSIKTESRVGMLVPLKGGR